MKPQALRVTKEVEFPDWACAMFQGKSVRHAIEKLECIARGLGNKSVDDTSALVRKDVMWLLRGLDGCECDQVLEFGGDGT